MAAHGPSLRSNTRIWWQMTRRAVAARYRSSTLGALWAWLLPVLMLAVYGFVFTQIFEPRWSVPSETDGTASFVIILFAGLLVFGALNEVVMQSAGAVVAHANFVKKTVFPLLVLPLTVVASAMFNFVIGLVILFAAQFALGSAPPLTALYLPVVLAPFLLMLVGTSWLLAALGTYLRDIGHILAPVMTAALFLAPILYPMSAIPEAAHPFIALNPITVIAEQVHRCVVFGVPPQPLPLLIYSACAVAVAAIGYAVFQFCRPGFADVL